MTVVHDRHAALPFDLRTYAARATGSVSEFSKDLGLKVHSVRQWAQQGLVPWLVYEAARKRFGTLGFSTPSKVARARPFRLPAHLVHPSIPAVLEQKPAPQSIPDLLLAIATQFEIETTGRQALLDRLANLERTVATLLEPKPVPPPEVPKNVILPRNDVSHHPPQTLETTLRARNGVAKDWMVTNRAEHDFAHLQPKLRERCLKVLDRVMLEADWRQLGAMKSPPQVARHFGVKDLWCFRAGKGRLLVTREGILRRVVALPLRSDKTVFSREA